MRAVFVYHGQNEGPLPHPPLQSKDWQLDFVPTNGPLSIAEYDLIVFAPMAFFGYDGGEYFYRRHRETQVALRNGKSVIFLVHQSLFQNEAHALIDGYLSQIGSTIVWVHPKPCVPVRTEFATYCDRYGHARVAFDGPTNILRPGASSTFNFTTLIKADERPAGITFRSAQGTIYCLPFQLAPLDAQSWTIFFGTLLDAISDYAAATNFLIPDWLQGVRLPPEIPLIQRIDELERALRLAQEDRAKFDIYKAILVTKGDALVSAAAQVLVALLSEANYTVVREERYIEDLWLNRERVHGAIVEVKGTDGNVRRGHINDLDSHRERYIELREPGIGSNFPALLVVNTFARESSIADKDQEIHPDIVRHAVATHVLVTRGLDLYRALELMLQSRIAADDMVAMLLERAGWLRVTDEPRIVN